MDGLCRALGCPVPFTAAGRTTLLRPLTLGDWGTLENLLLSRRGSPTDVLEAVLDLGDDLAPETLARLEELYAEARDLIRRDRGLRCVRQADLMAWLGTPDGEDHSAWLCLRRGRRDCRSPLAAGRMLDRAGADARLRFRRLRDLASGTDLFSALDWPPGGDGDADEHFPWKQILRVLAEGYGFDPARIAGMTLYNLPVYLVQRERLGGVARMDPADALSFVAARRELFGPGAG
jgi:hypothetical protein